MAKEERQAYNAESRQLSGSCLLRHLLRLAGCRDNHGPTRTSKADWKERKTMQEIGRVDRTAREQPVGFGNVQIDGCSHREISTSVLQGGKMFSARVVEALRRSGIQAETLMIGKESICVAVSCAREVYVSTVWLQCSTVVWICIVYFATTI